MKTGKNRQKISIYCNDGSCIKGNVYLNEGERMLDFTNDARKKFIAVTDAEFFHSFNIKSFKLASKARLIKKFIILNKSNIKWIEEI